MATTGLDRLSALPQLRLREQCAQQLRALVVAGALRPGELHSIGSVATELGVSITPVREALLDLAREELVELVRNRGFRVVTLTDDDLDELVQLRMMLEVPAIEQITAIRPAPDLSHARSIAAEASRCAADGDMVGFVARDRDLHLIVLSLLGNRRLVRTVGLLRDQTRLYGLQKIIGQHKFLDSAAEHEKLLDTIEAGDVPTAGELMRRHLEHTRGLWAGRPEQDSPR